LKNRIRYFALFREQTACASETVDWPGGTAAELFQLMAEGWETELNEGDEVLFFPPVAGG